jgi:anti-sigma B factor antagonist
MTSSFDTTPGKLQINLTGDLIGGADAMKFSVDLRESLAAFAKNPLLFKEGAGGGLVVIDAGSVGFVNSSGLGMLIAARQAAQEHGAEFRLHAPGEQLKHLLEVTKLTEILGAA